MRLLDEGRALCQAKGAEEQIKRQQSDFLAAADHSGAMADFYSLRHTHGSALADACVPQKDIQASLHHTSGRTTERYLHTRQSALVVAIGQLPLVKPSRLVIPALATGTDGKVAAPPAAPPAAPTTSGMVRDGAVKVKNEQSGKLAISSQIRDSALHSQDGLLAELADALDSKSCARKGVSVRLR
jgi:hypothetical protein